MSLTRLPTQLQIRLEERKYQGSQRSLSPRKGVDLCSNDYLDFSQDLVLRARTLERLQRESDWIGSTGSRLLRGNSEIFEKTEAKLADFCSREAALLFPSGYQANLGLLSAILGAEDHVFSDELNHASLIDGMRLGRARKFIYPHRDLKALELMLQSSTEPPGLSSNGTPPGVKWIVTESLFSMDGDQAPLAELAQLAEKYSAALIVDEAHATGIWGDFANGRGGGLVQALGLSSRVFATLHTGGKALGNGGAWIAGDHELKNFLIGFSRPLIFSTAPIPAIPLLLQESLLHWKEVGPARAEMVLQQSDSLRRELSNRFKGLTGLTGLPRVLGNQGPILPILIGDNTKTLALASDLSGHGYDLRAIRPPTVAAGSARLRLTCHPAFSSSEQKDFMDRLSQSLENHGRENQSFQNEGGPTRG